MAGFLFKLETVDGEPADPPTLSAAVPNWQLLLYTSRRQPLRKKTTPRGSSLAGLSAGR
jgi:hypothetical protein